MRYSAETTASVTEIMRRARASFGPDGIGLAMTHSDLLAATYSGAVGFVTLAIAPERGRGNTITIETREFDDDVVRFIGSLPRSPWWRQFVRRRRS